MEDLTLAVHQADPRSIEEYDEGHDEASWASYEIPEPLPTIEMEEFYQAAEKLHLRIATRTIITAARGGRLRRLYASYHSSNRKVTFFDVDVEPPFAIPALLPYWVAIEQWYNVVGGMHGWQTAASTLRWLLAHASLWLDVAEGSVSPRQNRELTSQEIQSLHSRYTRIDLHEIIPLEASEPAENLAHMHPLEDYLPWLAEDAELCQRVADVWNGIVALGQADDQECMCARCWA